MIYFVDEDDAAFEAWIFELELRGHDVIVLDNADDAFRKLSTVKADSIDVAIIDVMLAVEDPKDTQFDATRTDHFFRTGLVLLEDLAESNPAVFPELAVLFTNTANIETFEAAEQLSAKTGVPLWRKSSIQSPVDFGDRIDEIIEGRA